MGRVFVTGDTHQTIDVNKVKNFAQGEGSGLNKSDVVIVAGDFGVIWDAQQTDNEKRVISWYNSLPFSVAFVDGNHENHDRLDMLPTAKKWGNEVGVVSPFIFHLRRGNVYDINDIRFWVFGGGVSIDKARRQEYVSWWKQELPSYPELLNGRANLTEVGDEVDFIITHTAPNNICAKLVRMYLGGMIDAKYANEEKYLRDYFEDISDNVKFKAWFFGHFHVDAGFVDNKFVALYNSVVELEK